MSDSLLNSAHKILAATNGGLDEIVKIYPQADTRKNFSIRSDDRNPSASLKFVEDRWRLTDWSGDIKAQDCFGLYALENNVAYFEAILEIGRELQNSSGTQIFEDTRTFYKYEFRDYDLDDSPNELNEKNFHFETKDFNEFELQILGPHVTAEHCKEINLYSLVEYSYFNEEKKKVFRFKATDKFPIFAFINKDEKIGQWLKIYMPKGSKKLQDDGKDRRFRHVGGRPSEFIFGLERIKKIYNEKFEEERERMAKVQKKASASEIETKDVDFKLERICIATGGSDGINLLSLGEYVVWDNSETANLNKFIMKELMRMAHEVVNIPDCDVTGKREGKKMALQYLPMKTLWLDKYFKFGYQKDFKDFVRSNQTVTISQLIYEVKKMLTSAMPAQFWEASVSEKGRVTYNFHHMYAFYFLRLNGFCRIDDLSRKDGYYFARVHGHVVEELKTTQSIKDFFRNFLLDKQDQLGVREIPYSLLNMMITSQKITDGHLANMHNRTLDFTDFSPAKQYFFLGDRAFTVSAEGIKEAGVDQEPHFKNYVLQSQLINNLIHDETDHEITARDIKSFKIDSPYFKICKTGNGLYDIEILSKECDFLNYLVQVSRIHWEKERENFIDAGYKEEDFYDKTLFEITSKFLSDEENTEQKQHLINKIFAFGYSGHRFKDPTKPWVLFAADNAVIDDDVAEGGAGKSLFFEAMRYFMNRHDIDGKGDIENDKFLFEGVNQHTDFILFDDVRRNFSLESFFSVITSKLTVNEKFEAKVNLAYRNSPKFGVSTNYAIKDQRGSSTRRRLIMGFSDYYHASNDEREKRDPKDDFNNSLFLDWKTDQWFKFLNFVFQSTAFYMQQDAKIEAPDGNIKMRAYMTEMGQWFREWADEYYPNIIGQKMIKHEVLEQAKLKNFKYLGNMTSNAFKNKTKIWCKVNGYEFEDRIMENLDEKDEHGIIKMDHTGKPKKKTTEHIKLTNPNAIAELTASLQSSLRFETGTTDPYDVK